MARHFLELADAATIGTEAYLLTRRTVAHLYEAGAMGAVHGEAGTGKTFAFEEALTNAQSIEACWLSFPSRPTMRLVAPTLLAALTRSASPDRNRFEATAQLIDVLSHGRRVIGIDEAQRLNRECIEFLRHLHDHPLTTFALVLVGGDGCWEVLSREPMLRSRIFRRVVFRPLSCRQVVAMIRHYHPLYHEVADELVDFVDDQFAHRQLPQLGRVHTLGPGPLPADGPADPGRGDRAERLCSPWRHRGCALRARSRW